MHLIPYFLRELNLYSIAVRFIVAVLFGGTIGLCRGRKHYAAGLKTHLLLCVGAAAVMMINQYTCQYLGLSGDATRMGAQVISGIGFLGAGTIIVTGQKHIKGLTSAAGLWVSACMGLAIGIGFYEAALFMYILLFITLSVLEKFDENYIKKSKEVSLYLEFDSTKPLRNVIRKIRENNWFIINIEQLVRTVEGMDSYILVLEVKSEERKKRKVPEELRTLEGVLFVEQF
ncbi:protein SapB [Clostridiales bacterium]|nr:protein SapB [Clostridiales bacterium]